MDEVEGEHVKEEEREESDTADELEDEDDEDPAYAIEKMRRKIEISEARIADFQGMSIPQAYLHSRRRT